MKIGNPLISLQSYIFMKNQLHVGTEADLSFNLSLGNRSDGRDFREKRIDISRFLALYIFIQRRGSTHFQTNLKLCSTRSEDNDFCTAYLPLAYKFSNILFLPKKCLLSFLWFFCDCLMNTKKRIYYSFCFISLTFSNHKNGKNFQQEFK